MRRGLLIGVLAALAIVVLWGAAAAVTLIGAVGDASDGRDALVDARERGIEDLDGTELALNEAARTLASARDRARGLAAAPARVLPWLGRQVRAFGAVAAGAAEVADAAAEALEAGRALLDAPLPQGRERVAAVGTLAGIAERVQQRLDAVDLGPGENLLGALASRREQLADELADARETAATGAAALRSLEAMLAGPRSFLVLGANNAEMRAGAGMFLTAAVLRTTQGRLVMGPARSVRERQPPSRAVRAGGDMAARWGWLSPADDWRTLMLSPRFDASASLGARMWRAAGGRAVDGVLALDPLALEGLLQVTGPVMADRRRITAGNVADELLRRQYDRFAGVDSEIRQEALGRIASATFDALGTRALDPAELFQALGDAAAGRHLMIWSRRPAEQAAFVRAGLAGTMDRDSMLVSVLNRGGNKLDRWLEVEADLSIVPGDDGADGLLELRLANRAPAGLPRYVAGPRPQNGVRVKGEYLGFVAVTLPGDAGSGRVSGGGRIVAIGADGPTRVIASQVRLSRGEALTLRVRFRFASATGRLTVEPSAREPAVVWRYGGDEWRDRRPRHVVW